MKSKLVPPEPPFSVREFVSESTRPGHAFVVVGMKYTPTNRPYFYLRQLCNRSKNVTSQKSRMKIVAQNSITCEACNWSMVEENIEEQFCGQ